jgi:Arc/MetJ-type ribon-helix-helix transcriptional regulator
MNMTFQFKFSKIDDAFLNVRERELEEARLELQGAGYELLELWHSCEKHCHEIWVNSARQEKIRLNINFQKEDDETNPPTDASRSDIVSELVDLWLEMRAIRDHFTEQKTDTEAQYDDDHYLMKRTSTPMERFWQKVRETKDLKDTDPAEWNFIINKEIDESVFAFFELSESDRSSIIH